MLCDDSENGSSGEGCMKIIGITGPTGAGKTTVLHVLHMMGAEIIDADQVYHTLLKESSELREELVEAFGEKILDGQGRIDRKRLAQQVYPGHLEELNQITHPAIVRRIEQIIQQAEKGNCSVLAIDAIALTESGLAKLCDETVAVLAPAEVRMRRIMERDGVDETYARRRMDAQKSDSFFRETCDLVLENKPGENKTNFELRVREILETECAELTTEKII